MCKGNSFIGAAENRGRSDKMGKVFAQIYRYRSKGKLGRHVLNSASKFYEIFLVGLFSVLLVTACGGRREGSNPGGVIARGLVRNPVGQPLAGVEVGVMSKAPFIERMSRVVAETTTTDQEGRFEFVDLPRNEELTFVAEFEDTQGATFVTFDADTPDTVELILDFDTETGDLEATVQDGSASGEASSDPVQSDQQEDSSGFSDSGASTGGSSSSGNSEKGSSQPEVTPEPDPTPAGPVNPPPGDDEDDPTVEPPENGEPNKVPPNPPSIGDDDDDDGDNTTVIGGGGATNGDEGQAPGSGGGENDGDNQINSGTGGGGSFSPPSGAGQNSPSSPN